MLVLARRVERVAATGTLGAVPGQARRPQECRDLLAVLRIDRDTDTRLDHETMSLQDEGLFQAHEYHVRGARRTTITKLNLDYNAPSARMQGAWYTAADAAPCIVWRSWMQRMLQLFRRTHGA